MDFLKAERVNASKWRVLAIPFGGQLTADAVKKMGIDRPDNGIGFDSDGEFFSPNSDIKPNWFDRRPLVWHHNLDQTMKADPVIGTSDDLDEEEDGWWATLWLDRQHRYFRRIDDLLQKSNLYGSSGTIPNFAKSDPKTGEILVWPYIEQTLTPIPSNLRSRVEPVNVGKHFKSAGLTFDLDSLTADLPTDLDPTSAEDESGEAAATQKATRTPAVVELTRSFVEALPVAKWEQLKPK